MSRYVKVPPPEGYHYWEDHPDWNDEKQQKVIDMLWDIVKEWQLNLPGAKEQ